MDLSRLAMDRRLNTSSAKPSKWTTKTDSVAVLGSMYGCDITSYRQLLHQVYMFDTWRPLLA